ncbi:MAG: DUF7901 domain-containing protein [Planctomycetota bacterium]|jgi:hypothetical protein
MKTLNQKVLLIVSAALLIALEIQAWAGASKWSQPPVEIDPKAPKPVYCGWDESSFSVVPFLTPRLQLSKIVADDFRCLGTMPITSIRWWGSYEGWDLFDPPKDRPIAWLIGFWSNVPASPQADPDYSYPQMLLWQVEVAADRVLTEPVGIDSFGDKFSDLCHRYFVRLKSDEYFRQADYHDTTLDNVFWISIVAVYADSVLPEFMWGWKSRPSHWMDSAVAFDLAGKPEPGFSPAPQTIDPLSDTTVCGEPNSYDMAFELETDSDHVEWEQPFTGLRNWAHYEDEESMATGDETTGDGAKWIQQPDLSQRGLDVDATADIPPIWPPVTVADETNISIWSSFFEDRLPGSGADSIRFTLSIHSGTGWPGQVLWSRQFRTGEYDLGIFAEDLQEGWYAPALDFPNYQPLGDTVCWKYDFSIDPADAFVQQGTPDNPTRYWLSVQGFIVHPPGSIAARFGWKTSPDNHNNGAVWAPGEELPSDSGSWRRLSYPGGHPLGGENIDLAFELSTQTDDKPQQQGPVIHRLVADDWRCDTETPVTAVAWWGSYIGYDYQACECPHGSEPVRPDYFLLSIWTALPGTSHPRDKIWEYRANDFDEVLVGFDKHPHESVGATMAGHEPVFRYSVRVPESERFAQGVIGRVYWLNIVAVYTDDQAANYPWGWTNHEHEFQDGAVSGHADAHGFWDWQTLKDQTGDAADMSFVLFTDPR